MPSKRRLDTLASKPPDPKFLLDRNLGAYQLKAQLSNEGFDVTAHDEIFGQLERDPWIFYWAGKNNYALVTADLSFKKLFTHQAAIALGRTAVFSFSGANFNSVARGRAFSKARPSILRMLRKQQRPFIATILFNGVIHIDSTNPRPRRKKVDPRDWASYEQVCKAEGINPYEGQVMDDEDASPDLE